MAGILCTYIAFLFIIISIKGQLTVAKEVVSSTEQGTDRSNIAVTAISVSVYNITINKDSEDAKGKPLAYGGEFSKDPEENKALPLKPASSHKEVDENPPPKSQSDGNDETAVLDDDSEAIDVSSNTDEKATTSKSIEDSETASSSENDESETVKNCTAAAECYLDRDCGKGSCFGGRRCNCLGCPALVSCSSDKDCGGFNEACDLEKKICDCEKGAQAAGFDNYFVALSTLCQTECISSDECYGLRCIPGICLCQ
uniref:SMB domain-containing protein n=1 Tax=Syphacia muris TaxID=451379 RepID=A0A0N5AM17_9BILA